MFVERYILNESVVQPLMDAADLTDNGKKIFCEVNEDGKLAITKLSFKLEDSSKLENLICRVLNKSLTKVANPLKPVFASVTASNGFVGVYWRENVNQISTGKNWMLYHKFANIVLSEYKPTIELNNDKSIKSISLIISDQFLTMNNLNNYNYILNLT